LAAGVLLAPPVARAQVGVSLSVESDYRLRGISLTGQRPSASLDLSYDASSGVYLGGSLIGAVPPGRGVSRLGTIAYAGYALRGDGGRTYDFGVSDTRLESYGQVQSPYGGAAYPVSRPIRYDEFYAAASTEHFRLAVQYSPNYIASHTQALYVDLSGSARPAPGWRVFAYAGFLEPLEKPALSTFRSRWDGRVGVSRDFGRTNLHLAFTSHTGQVPAGQDRSTVIAGASVFF
jgi:uncharacterized protein (TIGR02001 family)